LPLTAEQLLGIKQMTDDKVTRFERVWRSSYRLPVIYTAWATTTAAMGTFLALHGDVWAACVNFFCCGIAVTLGITFMSLSLRLRDLTDLERAHLDRQAQQVIAATVEDLKRRGVLPPDTEVDFPPPSRLN
jgi:hypothetical protein